MTTIAASELPQSIQHLLDQRDQHVDAISKIDKTLADVTAALGGSVASASGEPAKAPAAKVVAKPPAAKKRGRGSFAVSATDLVLNFLKTNKSPTTKEINQQLLSEGRSAGAISNALSVLTSAKKLKRTPLGKGMMGSTYSLA